MSEYRKGTFGSRPQNGARPAGTRDRGPNSTTRLATVNVQISGLIFDGLPLASTQAALMRTALQDELSVLLSRESLPPRLRTGGAAPFLPGPALRIQEWRDPTDLGRRIAQALHEGLWR
jgi:hypothetical protein